MDEREVGGLKGSPEGIDGVVDALRMGAQMIERRGSS
jgi:hypothetical protein